MDWLFAEFGPSHPQLLRILGRGFSPALVVLGFLMYAAWTASYVCFIYRGFKDKAYGIPMVAVCLNVVWEFCFSAQIFAELPPAMKWGNRFWLVPDLCILYLVVRYGAGVQSIRWIREHWRLTVSGTFLLCAVGLPLFIYDTNDVYGILSSYMMNLVMSVLFLFMAYNRYDPKNPEAPASWRGIDYWGVRLKRFGSAISVPFAWLWWPAQFENGVFFQKPFVPEPRSYAFLYFLFFGVLLFDSMYLWMEAALGRPLLPRWKKGKVLAALMAVGSYAAVILSFATLKKMGGKDDKES